MPDFSEDQMVFLSMKEMLSRGKARFSVYYKDQLSVYYVTAEAKYLNSINLPAPITSYHATSNDTDCTPHATGNVNLFSSEGLTTCATERSVLIEAKLESNHASNSLNESNVIIDSDENKCSAIGGNNFRIPGPSDIWKDTGYEVYSTGRGTTAPRVRIPVGKGQRVDQSNAELLAAEFYRKNWSLLRTAGWKCVYFKSNVLLKVGKEIEVYVTPLLRTGINTNINKLNAVENVEFFYSKLALHTHVLENPCLLLDGRDDLWYLLSSAGWVEVHEDDGRVKRNYRPTYYALSFAQNYFKHGGLDELIPGLHKFASFQSLNVYIHRFPFLLQSEENFVLTLKRLNWVVNENKEVQWTSYDSKMCGELNLDFIDLPSSQTVWYYYVYSFLLTTCRHIYLHNEQGAPQSSEAVAVDDPNGLIWTHIM